MILQKIIKKTEENLKKDKTIDELLNIDRKIKDVKKFLKSTKENPYRIIAEVKKASPSKGVIREDFDPLMIAQEYEKAGANAISVLTEPFFFQGDLEYLTGIRRYVSTPLLRKDFIIDKYQLLEAVVYGADFVLLIAKALSKSELKELLNYTKKF